MKKLLWLDDYRNPFLTEPKLPSGVFEIQWVRDYDEFVTWIESFGLPDVISFDHDLKPEHYTPEFFWDDYELSKRYQESRTYKHETGEGCAKWLVDYCAKKYLVLPEVFIHSDNPVGANKIREVLKPMSPVDYYNRYIRKEGQREFTQEEYDRFVEVQTEIRNRRSTYQDYRLLTPDECFKEDNK